MKSPVPPSPSFECSPDRSAVGRSVTSALIAVAALLAAGCSDLPPKKEVLEVVQREVKEEANCTLPIAVLSRFKMQHATRAMCVAREGDPTPDATMTCLDALAAAGLTKRMPSRYMAEWPDEVSGAAFDSVSPYERRARDVLFKGCFEMTPELREGRFGCGKAAATRVLRMTKQDEKHVVVRYAREVTVDPKLAPIDAACGATTRPAPEATVTLEKDDKSWTLAPGEGSATPTGDP